MIKNYVVVYLKLFFDETTSKINEENQSINYMIECELKNGKSCALYFINKVISSLSSIYETNLSKKDIALISLTKNNKIKAKAP